MNSYSNNQKIEVVSFVKEFDRLNGRGGMNAARKKYGINPISIRKWCVEQGYVPGGKKKTASKKRIKVGDEFYKVGIDFDGKCELDTYRVSSIRKGIVFAILKDSTTWGKRSKKHGDFGWLPNIPQWCRCILGLYDDTGKFVRSDVYPGSELLTTKRAAWGQVVKMSRKRLARLIDEESDITKAIATAKRQYERLKK